MEFKRCWQLLPALRKMAKKRPLQMGEFQEYFKKYGINPAYTSKFINNNLQLFDIKWGYHESKPFNKMPSKWLAFKGTGVINQVLPDWEDVYNPIPENEITLEPQLLGVSKERYERARKLRQKGYSGLKVYAECERIARIVEG